jgi:hypothetical protein
MANLKRSLRPAELAKRGLELVNRLGALGGKPIVKCKDCGETWELPDPRERYTDHVFLCPNGCNVTARPL